MLMYEWLYNAFDSILNVSSPHHFLMFNSHTLKYIQPGKFREERKNILKVHSFICEVKWT